MLAQHSVGSQHRLLDSRGSVLSKSDRTSDIPAARSDEDEVVATALAASVANRELVVCPTGDEQLITGYSNVVYKIRISLNLGD
ncbi:hypothetical protein CBM2591_A10127 [Cupriavidus taiwanensis]|nr:hypothetical protein CBM2591_A10127 [Cupriavidus taiwanensis]